MNIRLLAAGAVIALAASACGNSGASSVPGVRAGADPVPVPTGSPGTAAAAQRSTMTISISIPVKTKTSSHQRRPRTVSPGTAYVDVVLQSLNGESQPASGPYTTLVPVSQLGPCTTHGGRGHGRAVQSSGCFTVSVPAPVGNDVYAVGALDANMTLLDYAENVAVTVGTGGTATLVATLNGVGADVIGSTMLTDPAHTTQYRSQYNVDCPAPFVQYDAKAVCSFIVDAVDPSGDDMAVSNAVSSQAYLANTLAVTVTDLTTQLPLGIAYDTGSPDPAAPMNEIDFDPANAQADALSGTTLDAVRLGRYNAVIHPGLSEIPANTTDVIEFKAVLSPPATTAFGPNVLFPNSGPVALTWDLSCKNVTVGPNDQSGLTQGSVLQFCEPQESAMHLVVQ